MFSNLLIQEPPLLVLPSLVQAVGLNEAITLQQLHYWLRINKEADKVTTHFHEGCWWAYNTLEQWRVKNFPFWSEKTISRAFKSLEDKGVIKSAHLSKDKRDRTKWYTIDYEGLNRLSDASGQNVHMLDADKMSISNKTTCPNDLYTETNSTERSSDITPNEEKNQFNLELKTPVERTVESKFDEFWSHTYRKVKKQTAFRAFKKALKKVDFKTLIEKWVEANRIFEKKALADGHADYIPHPSSWLNGGCWEDEELDIAAQQEAAANIQREERARLNKLAIEQDRLERAQLSAQFNNRISEPQPQEENLEDENIPF